MGEYSGTESERLALSSAALQEGDIFYEVDTGKTYFRSGGDWVLIGSSAGLVVFPIVAATKSLGLVPLADTELIDGPGLIADLGHFRQARLVTWVKTAALAGCTIRVQYSSNGGSTWSNLDGNTGPPVAIDAGGPAQSAWFDLPAAARGNGRHLRIMTKDGNGVVAPVVTSILLLVKP